MILGKYSFGIGDRFGHQGKAQLAAIIKGQEQGLEITPVWNKSNREHTIIGTSPADVRREADEAIGACRWKKPYYVDADHIGLANVERFMEASDFFTLDVADFIGRPAPEVEVKAFVKKHKDLLGSHRIEGIDAPIALDETRLRSIAAKYLVAVQQAGNIVSSHRGPQGRGPIRDGSVDG